MKATSSGGMIVLSGGQPLPNLLGLLILPHPPEFLAILHSASEKESKEPAQRFAAFARRFHLAGAIETFEIAGRSPDIQSSRQAVMDVLNSRPSLEWIINSTGGLKPMSIGAASLAGHRNCTVIYREQSPSDPANPWQVWERGSDGRITALPWAPGHEEPDFLDRFDAPALASLHFPADMGLHWEAESLPDSITPELILRMIRMGPSVQWNWGILSHDTPFEKYDGGVRFEIFLAGIIRAMGITRLWHSLRLVAENEKNKTATSKTEIDLVAIHSGRVFLIEAKLVGEETSPLIGQAQQLATRASQLGGHTASGAVVLPGNNTEDTSIKNLVQASTRCKVWTQWDMAGLVSNLKIFLGLDTLPEPAIRISQALEEAARHGRLFTAEQNLGYHPGPPPSNRISMVSMLNNWLKINTNRAYAVGALGAGIKILAFRASRLAEIDPAKLHAVLAAHHIQVVDPNSLEDFSKAHQSGVKMLNLVVLCVDHNDFSKWLGVQQHPRPQVPAGFVTRSDSIFVQSAEETEFSCDDSFPSAGHIAEIALLQEAVSRLKIQLETKGRGPLNQSGTGGRKQNIPLKKQSAQPPSLPLPPPPAFLVGQHLPGTLVDHPSRPETGRIYFSPDIRPELAGNTGKKGGNDIDVKTGDRWTASVTTQTPPTFKLISRIGSDQEAACD